MAEGGSGGQGRHVGEARRRRVRGFRGTTSPGLTTTNIVLMAAFPGIDAATGGRVLDLVRGCTFDDFILVPQYSVLPRRDPRVIDLSCQLTRRIALKRPIVSAN